VTETLIGLPASLERREFARVIIITTCEEEALKHLPAVLEGRRPPLYSVTYGGIDTFNALMTTKKAGLSLADVYRQQEEIHRHEPRTRSWLAQPAIVAVAPRYLQPLSEAH
jgi:hypothetical protein